MPRESRTFKRNKSRISRCARIPCQLSGPDKKYGKKKNNVSIEVFQEDELSKKIHNIEQENKGKSILTISAISKVQSSNKQSSKSRKLLLDDDDHSRDDNDDEPVGKSKEIRTKKKE